MRKKILVISGNPKPNSLSENLAHAYVKAATTTHDVRFVSLAELEFDPNLHMGYTKNQPLEIDLMRVQDHIHWSNHLVIITPIWWGGIPAKLKGLFDRSFLPGFAFKYIKGKTLPQKLLSGKTARIIMTMDTPPWYYVIFQGAPALKQLKITTLHFSGFRKIKSNLFGPVINASDQSHLKWLNKATRLGQKGA